MSQPEKVAKLSSHEEEAQKTQCLSPEERQNYIAEAAYYRALKRGLSEGYEQEDWLAAETEIMRLYPESR